MLCEYSTVHLWESDVFASLAHQYKEKQQIVPLMLKMRHGSGLALGRTPRPI